MARDTVARRYAVALFLAARKAGELEAMESEFLALREVIAAEPGLLRFLAVPSIGDDRKEALLSAVFEGRARPAVLRFLRLLLRRRRTSNLEDIIAEFLARAEEARGIVTARVQTAAPLTDDLAARLVARLEALTGKTVRLAPEIRPEVLGGAIVTIGDRTLDGSVRGRLDELREELLSVRVH
jgi:F-type H+-transporting ATPase subunit delta